MASRIEFIESVAREAGAILLEHVGRGGGVRKKGERDLVTAADLESEKLILDRIRADYPGEAILSEESADVRRLAPALWIIDPLDGTTNFVSSLPLYAVSIAFWREGQPEAACVFNPALEECFLAEAGAGVYREGRRLRVREGDELSEALLATGFHYKIEEKADSNFEHFKDLSYASRGVRRIGSAAIDLCYVAEGRFDGYWELHLAPWDVAAGGLIAKEAGALVTDFKGGQEWLFGGEIVAANEGLSAQIRSVLASADPKRLPGPGFKGGVRDSGS